jgi:hypothetical protein
MVNRSTLILKEKLVLQNGLVREAVIWKVTKSQKYPDGVRYRLALVDSLSGQILVLFDNHFPKGHHKHHHGVESAYEFSSTDKLVDDFLELCKKEEAKI